jgi:sugar phosphate isomerase/epimerase
MTRFSLAHLTALSLPPPALIRLAGRLGYATVGLRLIAVTDASPGWPLMDDAALLRETKAAVAESGVGVLDIEFVKLASGTDVASLERFMAVGAALGARHVIAAPYDADLARLADRFAALDALAQTHGMTAVLEFFPWTPVADLAAALRVVEASGRPRAGVLVDALHFDRSGGSPADLASVPPARLPFLHLCDAAPATDRSMDALIATARGGRLPPGCGAIDLVGIVAAMPRGIPLALEVPMEDFMRAEGPEAVARRAIEGARRILDAM